MHARPFADLTLPSRLQAAGQARRALTALVPDGEVAESGRLLVSEVVANAVEHTDAQSVRVLIRHDEESGELLCAVRDTTPQTPTVRRGTEDGERGRGLHLIEALSDCWGHLVDKHGKWTWFTLAPAAA